VLEVIEALDPVSAADDDARDALRRAFEIELGGRDFYAGAAADADDADLRDLFARLAAMELEHIDTLARRYHVSPTDVMADGVSRGARQAGLDHVPDDPVEWLAMAIELETRAERFFASHIEGTTPAAAQLYRELAAEEAEHVAMLSTELAAVRAGRGGLL
jgi:rubrerythrin